MENKILTNQDFLNYYGNARVRENKYGTLEAISYIIRNGKDKELLDTITEVINEYLDIYKVDGKIEISTQKMPGILADKLIDKKQRMMREKLDAEEKRYFKDKEVKMLIAEDIIERIK